MSKYSEGDAERVDRALVRFTIWSSLCLFVAQLVIGGRFYTAGISLFEENGVIESLQLFFLFLGTVFLARHLWRSSLLRPFYGVLTVLYLNLFLRELDVRELGLHPSITWLLGPGHHIWLTVLWIVALVQLWLARKAVFAALRTVDFRYLRRVGGFAVVVYILSVLAESGILPAVEQGREFSEEILETILEWCLVPFAVLATRLRARTDIAAM